MGGGHEPDVGRPARVGREDAARLSGHDGPTTGYG